jgi:sec-independent protein translocase protein TatC
MFLPISLGLFLSGVALAFFVVFQFVLSFLFQFYAWMGIDPDPRITDWLSFVLLLPLGFGISFQLPLVMLFLERIGVFRVEDYTSHWRMSVLVICVLAMVLTPNDVYSMALMAIPLILLYFLGVAMCKYMPRREPASS